jgi:[ribosomal protein S5]-alanine N-acetyltransferase
MSTRLETPRLVIRTFEPGDGEAWVAMLADPEVRRFLPGAAAPTMETFHGVIEGRHAMEREGGYAMWAVDEKETGTFVGQCGLRPVGSVMAQPGALAPAAEGGRREFDLAYHFIQACWNKGYATEAAGAVLAHGLGPLGLDCIIAVAMPDNIGSWRVMEKLGMRYQGLADYYGLEGLKKYVAEPEWWRPPAAA